MLEDINPTDNELRESQQRVQHPKREVRIGEGKARVGTGRAIGDWLGAAATAGFSAAAGAAGSVGTGLGGRGGGGDGGEAGGEGPAGEHSSRREGPRVPGSPLANGVTVAGGDGRVAVQQTNRGVDGGGDSASEAARRRESGGAGLGSGGMGVVGLGLGVGTKGGGRALADGPVVEDGVGSGVSSAWGEEDQDSEIQVVGNQVRFVSFSFRFRFVFLLCFVCFSAPFYSNMVLECGGRGVGSVLVWYFVCSVWRTGIWYGQAISPRR